MAQVATLLQVQDLNRNPEADMSLCAAFSFQTANGMGGFSGNFRHHVCWIQWIGPQNFTTQTKILEKLNEVKLVAVGRRAIFFRIRARPIPPFWRQFWWTCRMKLCSWENHEVFPQKNVGSRKKSCFEHRVMTYWFGNLRVDFSENSYCAILGWFVGAILIIEGVLFQGHNFRLFWG